MYVPNFKIQGEVVPEKQFICEKEKWTNKGNGRHENAESLLHNTSSYTKCWTKFKILCAVVSEKLLTQISLCITLEWEMEKG